MNKPFVVLWEVWKDIDMFGGEWHDASRSFKTKKKAIKFARHFDKDDWSTRYIRVQKVIPIDWE